MLAGWIQAGSKGSTTILPLAISSLIVRSLSTIGGIVASAFAKCKIRSKWRYCLLSCIMDIGGMKRGFEIIDHTADVGIIAYGKDIEELFCNAALALFSLIAETEN